ncbi:MaoC family dehydratase [Nocardia pseudovaccinii]|uniref:MaoC family dehydratase n=1 Tax=Nocardia pseudovaccinii TaxID=189540 RepID=UPI0007A51D38|nr:MaoC family dehydratase [Nocardia pseudovaccinii]
MTRFEDFTPGDRMRHYRGTTVTDVEGQLLSKLVMNSAQAHFNDDAMAATPFGQRIVFGLLTASLVVGMATQDTAEDAIAEIALDKLRFRAPVVNGDTIYAATEVIATEPATDRADAGLVRFKHWGFKADGTIVFEGERTVLLKRESHHPREIR